MTTVLHVMTRLKRGGGEQRLRDMVAALPESRHRLIVGECAGPVPDGVEIVPLAALRRVVDPRDDISALRHIRAAIDSLPADAMVVSHFSKGHLLVGLALASLPTPRRRPMILSLSMSPTNERLGRGFWYTQRGLDAAVHPLVLAVGREVKAEYERLTGSRRVHVVRTSIGLAPFLAARLTESPPAAPTDAVRLLFVGTLEKRKGIGTLPELTSWVAEHHGQPVHLRVAGDGPMLGGLRTATWHPAVRADFLGFRDDIPGLMTDADVLVLPSRAEGLSQVLVQATAVGLPFATTPVTGTRELVELGAPGVIAAGFGVEHLAAAIVGALHHPATPPPGKWISQWLPEIVHERYREVLSFVGRP